MSDHNLFNQVVYTPLSEAIAILEERQKDKELIKKIENLLDGDIPEPLRKIDKNCVQARQIATPNYDTYWFLDLIKDRDLKPVFLEYYEDKLTSNNDLKHSFGILCIHKKINKKGNFIEEKINIVNFSKDDGKKIKDVVTVSGETLVDFHHRLFESLNIKEEELNFYDASSWFKSNGGNASNYYRNFLLLFICHGILFENYICSMGKEGTFTKDIFLAGFDEVFELTGLKPLIVPIPPLDDEDSLHWFSYKDNIKLHIKS